MNRIQYNVFEHDTRNASGKAKKDVCHIMEDNGFALLYHPNRRRWIRVPQQIWAILRLKQGTCLFVQYPANIAVCYKLLSLKRKITTIAIVHDLQSLRGFRDLQEEVALLNGFDTLISHNPAMTSFLRSHGVDSKIVELGLFDYLVDKPDNVSEQYGKYQIAFAGNLDKSVFIKDIGMIKGVRFSLYGLCANRPSPFPGNAVHAGDYSPEEIVSQITGGWGLVWDGDSLETCSGVSGRYLQYNCPHKLSMYIIAERPVIIWRKAAMADYVMSRHLGIAIDSLHNLRGAIDSVSGDDYSRMLAGVRAVKKELAGGSHLRKIIKLITK